MSDDLVKRLRERSRQYVDNEYNFDKRAADRIEKLEAAMRRIADLTKRWEHDLISQANEIARKALEGKDD